MRQRFRLGGFSHLIVAALLATHPARADKMVVAYSSAAPGYAESRMKDGKLQPHTYVFMQGTFFPGSTRDRSLERMPFSTIANRLAIDLKEQAFFPAKNLSVADLLLVVHWGVIAGKERDYHAEQRVNDYVRDLSMNVSALRVTEQDSDLSNNQPMGVTSFAARLSMDFEMVRASSAALHADISGTSAAVMLGFAADVRREQEKIVASELQKTLVTMLEADRYFIVVMAYDRRILTTEKKLKRLWTCRLSIRSPGVKFPIALDRMGEIGSNYFGSEQVELKMLPAKRRQRAEVKVGDAIVIEYQTKDTPAEKPVEKPAAPAK